MKMYFPDFSTISDDINLKKTSCSLLNNYLDSVTGIIKEIVGNISPSSATELVWKSAYEQCVPREMTPELSNYMSRMALRNLVGLPSIKISTREKDAVKKLEGSISWITKEKIDVTEIIREMREV